MHDHKQTQSHTHTYIETHTKQLKVSKNHNPLLLFIWHDLANGFV